MVLLLRERGVWPVFFFFQAEDGIRDLYVTGVQTCALPISPPAPTREAIKSGKFDAVVFTSSSTVRNLVGIAGKPHSSTVIAVIGPATLKTAEEHGLRVDAMAETPSAEELADALARFGADRRDTMVEAGEPVTRPSERRSGSRRKS